MSASVDEEEHSIEMHLPYVAAVMGTRPFTLVPILVGNLNAKREAAYGALLRPFLEDPANLFVVSSDFCHWGKRFQYTYTDPACAHIHEGIEALDRAVCSAFIIHRLLSMRACKQTYIHTHVHTYYIHTYIHTQ
jgi:AmmeMemoRadiSam system protein B